MVALDNFILTDTLPSQFELKSITTGTGYTNPPSGNFIAIRYKTTANSNWTIWTGSPFAASATALPVTALSLGTGVYVTAVEMNFGTVPIGFATSGTAANKPKFTGVVNNPARDASAVTSGTTIINSSITLNADYGGSAITPATATATATMAYGTSLTKTSSAASYDFGQAVIWRLRPQTTSLALTNFVVTDTLPSQFELTSVYTGTGWTAYPATGVFIRYATTTNPSYTLWPGGGLTGGAYAVNLTANVSALSLPAGVYVTAVQFDYGTVANNFSASATAASQPNLTGVVQKFARDGTTISTVTPITNITNNATITATLGGTPLQPSPASATVIMNPPTLTTSLTKAASPSTRQLGQPFDWQLTPVAATTPTTLSLNNFTVTDTLPGAFELQSVYTGTGYANSPTGNFIGIRYKTTANAAWTNWTNSPFAANTTLNVSSLGLTAGVYVTDVEINYGTVAGNFAASATAANKPRLTGVVNSPARNGATIQDNGTVTNSNATLSATFGGVAIPPQTASAAVTLNTLKIKPYSVKTVPNLSYIPGGTIPFQVETWNDSTSQGAMVNPVGTDLLPAEVDYLPGTFAAVTSGTYNSAGVATPVLTVIPNYSGTRTLLRWQYSGSFAPNTRATVTFNVKVRSGTSSSDFTNLSGASAAPATNQQMSYPSGVLDTLDLNGNGSTTDYISQSTAAAFNVGTSAAVDATKWVKGVLDKVYTKYPDYGATVAGGSINYNINITNVGSVNLNNLMLIDLLPSVGDVGVIDTSPRLSAWTPELTGPILVDNATVLYSTQANPNRSEVGGPVTGNLPNWSPTLPADPTTVRSFKIVWNSSVVLTPGQALNFYIPMRAPLDAADGMIAWNSFAWAADPTGFPHLSAEPNKVGVGVLNTGKAIGNFVWLDENSDGYQDPGEPGIPNVKVNLYDSTGTVVASTWTDSSGHYLFNHLDANNERLQAEDYYVRVDASTLPPGVSQTPPSTLPNADFGNQDQSAGYGYLVPATKSGADLTADFGYNYNPAADVKGNTGTCMIGDRVWLDLNGDGKQTPDEIGIAGVQLQLITAGPDGLFGTADDVIAATTTTDATGYYRFDGLAAGAYQVKVSGSGSASHNILGAGYSQTGDPDHFGATSALNNDNLSTIPIVLGPGDVFLNADFGYQPTSAALGSIGDFVWLDANASGTATADAGEYGLSNVTVALIKDTNGNGIWDAGEPIIATTTTAANGAYLFTGLPQTDAAGGNPSAAKYLVWVNDTNNALAQLRQTYDSNGLASPHLSAATLSSGTPSVLDQDFSYAPGSQPDNSTAVIGDKVWLDANRNGILDGTELGVPGVLMELVDTLGRVLALTLTDADGFYFFGGLSPTGTYSVRIAARNFLAGKPLAGLVNTYDANGGLDGVSQINLGATGNDGNADPDGIKNGLNLGQDFGYGPPSGSSNQGTIGNLIWLDDNANGVRDGVNGPDGQPNTDDDEPGIQGVTVDLYRDLNNNGQLDSGEPLIATTTTDANGAYLFSGLPLTDGVFDPLIYATDPDASYMVHVSDRNGVLRGYWHSLGTAGTDNQSQINPVAITLTSTNPNVLSADFGYYLEPAAIGNYVWVDTNGNGLQDETGTGLANVEVILTITYPDGRITTLKTLTDASGHYTFGNLLQDENYTHGGGGSMPSFVVSVAPNQPALAAYSQTHIGVGSNPRLDSSNPAGTTANPVKGLTQVTGQSTMPTYDFGYFPTSELLSLGNRLWVDSNNNGIMDAGEPGMANVQVDLIDSTGVAVQATTYTDANGYYRFDGVLPGNYFIHIPATNWTGITGSPGGVLDGTTPLAGYHSSLGCATAAETSGTLAVTGIDHGVDNASPETNGIGSLVVTLAAGNQPTGDMDSGATGAGTHGANGDVRDNLALDFGFFAYASIGDFVWNDANANGVQDSGETGLAGVVVSLYRPGYGPDGIPGNADDSSPVATQTTPASGAYSFTGLLPGIYQVGFGPLSGYNRTLANQGTDGTKDSDPNPATGLTGTYLLASGTVNNSIDAGYYQQVALAGNVYDDANGLTDNTVNGSGTNVGGTLYANLIDGANKVAQVVAVAAGGSYTFGNVAPNTNYTVVLSTTQGTVGAAAPAAALPVGYANTGEHLGAGTGSDGTVDGSLAVAVTTSSVTNANLGIDQLPDSGTATATSQVNPGGTTSVSVSASLFSGTDVDGTVASLRIIVFPSNATSITINGTTYTSGTFPVGGVTVPANTSGQPTQAISVDPIDGAVSVVISYAVIDNAGKEDPSPGSVTLPFTTVSVAGTVFDDANGATDSLINGTGTNASNTLYANLINGSGNVVAAVPVASNGTYNFSGVNGGNYTVVLSTTQGTPGNAAPAASLPANWVNTGEGTNPAGDGSIDGVTPITVATTNVSGVNFGIEQLPNSGTATASSQVNPGGTTSVSVSASLFSATDVDGTVTSIRITGFPSNATSITINGTTYTAGTFPGAGVTVPANTSGQPTQAISVDPIDGALSVAISFAAIDNAGKEDPSPGSVTLPFTTVSVAGTVFDDAIGLTDSLINGTGTNAGDTLYANLVNGSGNVVAAVPVASNGTYSFSGVNGGNYTVVLSTTQGTPGNAAPAASLPANWVNTGEGTNPAGDGSVNGVTPITVAATNVSGVNFGIEQLPDSLTLTAGSQVNPGGTTSVAVSASLFSATDADGTVESLRIIAFPTNATSITINGTTYTSGTFPGAGVTVPTNGSGQPTQAISVDPIDGAVSVAIPYAAIDNAGMEDPTPGSVTLPFSVSLSGIVFDDANGSKVQNGGELGTNAGGLYVNLLDQAGVTVVATATVGSDGTYLFSSVTPNTIYVLQLTNLQGTPGQPAPAITLPTNWVTTGENSSGTPDANPNSKLQVAIGTANGIGQNFGIEQTPDTIDLTATAQANPGGTTQVTVPTLAGTDPEDGALGSGKSFQIITLPVFGTLYYNSVAVTAGQTITNYTPSLLTVDPLDGAVMVDFNYAAVDAAGKADPTPATVTMPFTTLTIGGTVWDDANGSANDGIGNNGFLGIWNSPEVGTDAGGIHANLIGSDGMVIASVPVNADGTYSFTGLNGGQSGLKINLTPVPATVGATAPAGSLHAGWVNTSPLLQNTFNLITTSITAKDFGIERPPNAQGVDVAGQVNPGGTISVTVPSTSFVGTDPETPGVTTYVITAMPANADSITINGTKYGTGFTAFPLTDGVSVTAVEGALPTGVIAIDPVDGAVTVPILFKVIDAAGKSSNVSTVNVPFGVITLSGTVWDDANGSANDGSGHSGFLGIWNTPETGTNAGGLYAILVNNLGKVVANAPVNADGSYSFNPVTPNQAGVTIQLATTAGTVGSPPPTPVLSGGWVNTSPLSQTAFDIVETSISGKDFGIEQLPDSESATAASQANPGGTVSVVLSPSLFHGTDADGTVTFIRITSFPTNATSITINGTTYTSANFPALGVTVPTDTSGYPTQAISVDPGDGAVSVAIRYAAIDNAGKEDPTPGMVTVPFTYITLSGTVFDDANGLLGIPANTVDGTGTNISGTLYVNLIDQNNVVLATTAVNANGTYSFINVPPNTLTEVMLTINQGVVGQPEPGYALPPNWVNTGESANGTPDGHPDGELKLSVGTSDVNSLNFGIEQLPDTQDKRPPAQANPGGTVKVTVPTLTGTDPEDGTLGVGNSFEIINLPTNGILYYNGVPVVAGQVITSYNPDLLTVDPNDGAVTVTFSYAAVDVAGRVDPTPATVVMPFTDITLAGTVFDDANGSQVQDGVEPGMNATGTYINLLDATGTTVVATAAVNPDGTYNFANVPPNTTYKLQLTIHQGTVGQAAPATALPAGWVTTGENSNGTPDGAPNSLLTVVLGTSDVSGQNFGIEQLPTANPVTAASQPNPGGTNRVPVPALTGTDPEDVTTSTVVIDTLPGNGTLYYNGTAVTVGQVIPDYSAALLTLDPGDGSITVSFTYSVTDAAGKSSAPATVSMAFTAVGIAGNVYDDANGLTDNTVNGTGTDAGGTLYANLVDGANTVVQAVVVAGDGSYVFGTVVPNTSYTIVLSTTQGTVGATAPLATLPAGYVNTGEHIGAGTGSDGAPDGSLAVAVATSSVSNANFGIDQPPTANPVTAASQPNPGGTNRVTVPALTGTDPEDVTTSTVVIDTLPGNGTLYYNGSAVTQGQSIPSFNSSLLTLDPGDGSITVSFTYSVTDAAGKSSAPATVSMAFTAVSIAGNVYDDANGLIDNTVNGTGTDAGGTLYANLVDGAYTVVQAVVVAADGSYVFGTVTPNTSYTIVLSTTQGTAGATAPAAALPAGYVNTGENIGTGTGSDGTPDGSHAVTVATSSVTNVNFGIEQLPTAYPVTAASQFNPAGTAEVTVPTLNGTDPEDATVTTFVIKTLPSDGTLYYNGTAVTVGQKITAYDPSLLKVDPNDGSITVSFTYTAVDAAGKESAPATVSMPFAAVGIAGNVFDDANGLLGTPVNTVDGTGTNAGGTLYANLVDGGNKVVQAVAVAGGGSYSFGTVAPNTSYSIVLSTTQGTAGATAPAAALPSGWVHTGEHLGAGAGSDGTPNGILAVTVVTSSVTNANFGIEQPPTADAITAASQTNPGGTAEVTVATLTGTDPEDPTVTTFVIKTLPGNATLYYNGTAVTAGQKITNYDPSLLKVDPNDGSITVSFTYTAVDAAGKESAAATVSMPFTAVGIAGNVFDDANGLLGTPVNTVDGTGTNAGGTLFANLVDGSNKVVQAVAVALDGSYSFGTVAPNTSYTIVLSTTQGNVGATAPTAALPAGYVNTGENIGTGIGSDGLPNGILAVAVVASSVTNANFGIEQPPTANPVTAASQFNPAGTAKVTVLTLSGTDLEDPSVTTFVINTLPANATLYYNGTPVTLGQVIPNYSASLLTVDPNDGSITVSFTYSVTDAAGKSSAPADVTMPFVAVGIAGNVYNDANGLTDNTVNGSGTNAGGTLYANLVNGSNEVVQAVAVAADGSYTFGTVAPNTSYIMVLSTTQGTPGNTAPAATLPAGYVNTGENIGAGSGSDGSPDGRLAVAVTTSSITNANFGIRPAAISGYVLAGTTPIAGVHLTLLDQYGNPVDGDPNTPGVQPVTAVTDSNGFYIFSGVAPGIYQVAESQPAGYSSFGDRDGGNLNIIGDVTPVVVVAGQTNSGNTFLETSNCPSNWAEWISQRPGQGAADNPDGDAYDNLAEFAFAMPSNSGAGNAWRIQPSTLNPDILEGVFVRPKGAPLNVTYTLQYAAAPGNPTVWQSIVITPEMITTVDNGDCTETVTIHNLETLTGLTAGKGIVRIEAALDESPPSGTDHTSFTEVEGWTETTLGICCRTYNNPYLRETVFTGTVDATDGVSGQALHFVTSAGTVDLATLLAPGVAYYLEVTAGANEGQRFDVVSASGSTVTLATDSNLCAGTPPFNTLITIPNSLAGDRVVIRRHWTLGQLFPVGGFFAAGNPTLADQVQTFANGAWTTYWLYDNSGSPKWVNVSDGTLADQAGAVMAPGQGMFVLRRNAAAPILAYGEVRDNAFKRPLCAGMNLVAGGYPLSQSTTGTASRQMNLATGFFGSRDFKTADSLFIWKADASPGASGYDTYYLLNRETAVPAQIKWVKVGDATLAPWDATKLLPGDASAFIRVQSDLHAYTIPRPWNP